MAIKTKGTHPGTELARQAFLYQGVSEIKELAELSGKAECTIRGHMEKWVSEREETLKNANPLVVANPLSVSGETLEAHKKDISFIRRRIDEVSAEIEALESIIFKLEGYIDKMGDDTDKALAMLDKYLRFCMNRKSLVKLFLDLKNAWDSKSGVDSLKSVQETVAKAVGVASAKSEPVDAGLKDKTQVSDQVFRKRI